MQQPPDLSCEPDKPDASIRAGETRRWSSGHLTHGLYERLLRTLEPSTFADIAAEIGMTEEKVRRHLTDHETPPLEFLARVAVAYEVSLDWLVLGR